MTVKKYFVLLSPPFSAESANTGYTGTQEHFSSSSFSLNGSRLLGISSSRVPVFVRCADSYQELGQNFPWEKSNFPETWQVETFHTEHTFPQCLLASDLMARLTPGGLGFCMKLLLSRKLTFVTLCMEGTVVYLPLSPSFGRGH